MSLFSFDQIREYQLEITSYCNAACPQCPRNLNGGAINTYMPLTHLDREVIDRTFDQDLCNRLSQVFFCGSYGDPIMHPNFLEILGDFRNKSPNLWLYFHSNGGVHGPDYWQEIAQILNGHGQIDFGIDGLRDTLSLYRRNVVFDRVIDNAKAFINAGGRAQWNFIVFEHNQHQVEQAQKMSQALGFINFLPRHTGRFFHHGLEQELDQWPVINRRGQIEYYIKPPTKTQWRNRSTTYLPILRQQHQSLRHYWDTTTIRCDAVIGKKVAINAQGLVLPCNFFNHNLYDARFYIDVLPGSNTLHSINGKNQVRSFLEHYGLDNLNINHKSLSEIFQCKMWDDLAASWNKNIENGRLFECAMTCGEKFRKVWDQGGDLK